MMSNLRLRTSERVIVLDWIRILSAFAVMSFHYCFWTSASGQYTLKALADRQFSFPTLGELSWWGWVGVQSFFVISGYVIFASAADSTAEGFLKARVARLLPTLIVCASITSFVLLISGVEDLHGMLPAYLRSIGFCLYGPFVDGTYWTLGIEVTFYAAIFLALLVGLRLRLEYVVAVIGLQSALQWLVKFYHEGGGVTFPHYGWASYRTSELLLLQYGIYFGLGAQLWVVHQKGWTLLRSLLLCLFIGCGVLPILSQSRSMVQGYHIEASSFWPILVWLASVGFVAVGSEANAWLSGKLSSSAVDWSRTAGLATYPFYLIHQSVGVLAIRYLVGVGVDKHIALIATVCLMASLSVVTVIWLEPPLRSCFRWIWGKVAEVFVGRTALLGME